MLWRVAKGIAVAEVASPPNPPRDVIEFDVAAALRTWGGEVGDRSLWVVCRLEPSRWHVARVRSDVPAPPPDGVERRSEEHTSELQSRSDLVCRLLLEKKKKKQLYCMRTP